MQSKHKYQTNVPSLWAYLINPDDIGQERESFDLSGDEVHKHFFVEWRAGPMEKINTHIYII